MSAKHEWLNLLEVSGPFLAVPVLREVFPQGLEELDSSRAKRLRSAYEEWRDVVDGDDADRDKLHAAWIDEVLRTALEADDQLLKAGKDVPASLVELPEHDTAIAPEFVFVDPTHGAAVLAPVHVFPPDTDLSASMKFGGLSCSAGDRMALHLRALNVPFGIVTNGERWMLVHAPTGEVATFASWYARIWGQEPATLRAFTSLLGVRRFFAPAQDRLPALFERSLKHQDEVTDALGDQVRRAIEVLVQALDRADQDRNRELLRDVKPQELYEAGLTVMMRLVFLLAAEERGLLLLGEPRYDSFYAVSTLRMQLRAESDEILERRRASWSRLLAVFRAVFGGIDHPTLRLPAMGGSLFDPDRFPFLEGRLKGTSWRQHRAEPLPIDDRTVLLLLEAIQTFEGRTLSYRALDVEQIGHVYEGLLERTVSRVEDVTLELEAGAQAKDARVTLGELESARLDGQAAVTSLLVERSKRSESAIKNALGAEVEPRQDARLLSACRGDVKLRDRLAPYVRLMRTDPWGYPLVHPKGAFVVVLGADRRETGTHYTPKSLTERIVEETLTPLVYDGPAKGAPRAEWKLHTPEQLLDLKVCDPAMGSGAFLVQACRFLSARLVEAWAIEETAGRVVDLTGQVHEPRTSVECMPPSVEARAENARRIVAERCLYGVDLNPLAVELAKLSLWLVTLSKGRPFGFLDHNLRRGDSLLGISRLEQLTELSLDPSATRQGRLFGKAIEKAVAEAVALRRKLHEIPIRDIRDVEAMATLDADARKKLKAAELLADAFIGVVFAAEGGDVETRLAALAADAERVVKGEERALDTLMSQANNDLAKDSPSGTPRRPFHWMLAFPEVYVREAPGFDAWVSNPPFMGGRKISSNFGDAFEKSLKRLILDGAKGSVNLVAYFLVRSLRLLRATGTAGFIATDSITESDTRTQALARVFERATTYFGLSSFPWPGTAGVHVSVMVFSMHPWEGQVLLDGTGVDAITTMLEPGSELDQPEALNSNVGFCSDGVKVQGIGFVLDEAEATSVLAKEPKSSAVITKYIVGDDINNCPRQTGSRWVINFWTRDEDEARRFKTPWAILEERVKPYRDTLTRQVHEACFWKFWDRREAFHNRVRQHGTALVTSKLSKHFCITFGDPTNIYSEKVKLFDFGTHSAFAVLQSVAHTEWALLWGSSTGETPAYVGTTCFDTFPFPSCLLVAGELAHDATDARLEAIGREYLEHRAAMCRERQLGFTGVYNLVHSQGERDSDVVRFRALIAELDRAVLDAYGWKDIELNHDFVSTKRGERYGVSAAARSELLKRLSTLNRQRHTEEHAAAPAGKRRSSKGRSKAAPAGQGALALVEAPAPKSPSSKAAAGPAKKTSTRRPR